MRGASERTEYAGWTRRMSSESPQPVRLSLPDPASRRLWSEIGRLTTSVLPADWTLVGGLMVQLHAFEAGEIDVRVTNDVDILADARKRERFQRIVRALEEDGFELQDPGAEQIGHRWERDGLVLDLLAPEGLKDDPRVTGQIRTVQIPGGTQALARTELVNVEIDGVICQDTRERYRGWCERDLSAHDLVYCYLDAIYLKLRPTTNPPRACWSPGPHPGGPEGAARAATRVARELRRLA